MTTTDPTITIAGLRAQVESLETSLRAALDDGATSEEVRLIAAAENACLTAERDALAAQLAEVRAELSSDATKRDGRISAICRALDIDDDRDVVDAIDEMRSRHANDLASERAHLAACRTRIAGLEQAADERSAEVAAEVARLTADRDRTTRALADAVSERTRLRDSVAALTARVAELEARPVLDGRMLAGAISHAHDDACARWAGQSNAPTMTLIAGEDVLRHLGAVTLPAQDRAEDLSNAYVDEWNGRGDCRGDADAIARRAAAMRRALASLGAPPTSPGTAAGVPVTPERGK